jgi:[FeFe] hydrogenase H-cluster maturation GTPase HydF
MSLQETPRSNRLHIGIYGKRNTGKSSLINALTNQTIALVSDIPGTTTDPVFKSMEINGIGPCVFIDTAGFDDVGEIGELRIVQTKKATEKTDIALVLFSNLAEENEVQWIKELKAKKIPVIAVINKSDMLENIQEIQASIEEKCKLTPIIVSSLTKSGIMDIHTSIIRALPEDFESKSITGNLVSKGDSVLLVMPQDLQAPKGRLILPQVQVIRELLDKQCIVTSITTDMLELALSNMKTPPRLIITDSQVFKAVFERKPEESMLTSFSVLLAANKGDIDYLAESAKAISSLTESSRVLIAEACTHAPLTEDIGREKIPRFLRQRIGENLSIDIVSGNDFPEDLSSYELIIHCGACMFNRKYMLSRIEKAKASNIPMTNYGVTIAYLTGILDRIDFPN